MTALPDFLAPFRTSPEELVYLRALAPRNAPPHLIRDYPKQASPPSSVKGMASYVNLTEGGETLKDLREQNKRRGIYFVVNPGGDSDLDINRFVATFGESDPPDGADIAEFLAAQLAAESPLPPSAELLTYKSVHRHWLIEGECSREEYLLLQQGQIAYYHCSDPAIMNESRVMRLPNLNHVRVDYVKDCLLYKPIELASFNPGRKYSVAQLQAAFPVGAEGLLKVYEKLTRPEYKAAKIEPTEELRKEVEAIRKQPRSSSAKAPKDNKHDKITTLAEVLQRERVGERLKRLTIETADYSERGVALSDAGLIEGTIARMCLQLANAAQGKKDNTLLHCGKILYGLVKGELAAEERITELLLAAVSLAGEDDPQFDPAHAEQTARHAYNYAKAETLEGLRARDGQRPPVPEPPPWMDDAPGPGEAADPPNKKSGAKEKKAEETGDFGVGFYNSLRDLHAKETVPADDLMIGVRRRQVTIFASVTNVGKTTIMLNHALAAAGGQMWLPLMSAKPDRPLKVVFIDAESTDDELKHDTLNMLKVIGNRETALDNFIPVVDAQINGEALDLSNKKHFLQIKRFLQYHKPDIVILDTISSLFSLFSENDNAEVVRKVIRPLKELGVAGDCAVWASHHIGKSGESDDAEEAYRGRGASAFGANVRSVITLRKEKALGEGYVRLTLGKSKGSKLEPVNLKLVGRTFEICATAPQSQTPYQQVIGIFNGKPLKSGEIKKMLADLSGAAVDRALREAVKNGDLYRAAYGAYERPNGDKKPTSSTSSSPIGVTKLTKFDQPQENKEDTPHQATEAENWPDEVSQDEFWGDSGDVEGEWVG